MENMVSAEAACMIGMLLQKGYIMVLNQQNSAKEKIVGQKIF